MSIRVLLADDHQLLRDALRKVLDDDDAFEVVGEAEDGLAAVEAACRLEPDVVVMDLLMPGLNGIDATRRIVAQQPAVKVLALSIHSGRRWVLGALEAGASGYVLKADSYAELRKAVRTLHAGNRYLCAGVAGAVVDAHLDASSGKSSPFKTLTPREREVVQLIAEGRSSREIADLLKRSPHTIDSHRRNVMRKLGLSSVAELTKYSIREGLTTTEE